MTNQFYIPNPLPVVEEPSSDLLNKHEGKDAHYLQEDRVSQAENESTKDNQKMKNNQTRRKKSCLRCIEKFITVAKSGKGKMIRIEDKAISDNDTCPVISENVDQKPNRVEEPSSATVSAQQEPVPEEIQFGNNQQGKSKHKSSQYKKEKNTFTRLLVVFAIFMISASIFGLIFPKYIILMAFWTVIPIFITLLVLLYMFLNQN